jgi:hypothetical protein
MLVAVMAAAMLTGPASAAFAQDSLGGLTGGGGLDPSNITGALGLGDVNGIFSGLTGGG